MPCDPMPFDNSWLDQKLITNHIFWKQILKIQKTI